MKQLETGLIEWFVARLDDSDPIRQQLRSAEISAREFTSGGGAFLSLRISSIQRSSSNGEPTYIDGPEIQSPELASGALVTLHLAGGVADSIEIWSYAGDYPVDRHPVEFDLVMPPGANLIDLR